MINSKDIIIGIFVKKTKILSFLEFLRNKMYININKVFIFVVEENDSEYLVTFSTQRNNQYFSQLHDATILHTKNGCLFSINALNMYIDRLKQQNIPNKDFVVDWDELRDCLLITTNGVFKKSKLIKIINKCSLL